MSDTPQANLPLVQEELSVDKDTVVTGGVRVQTRIDLVAELLQVDLARESVEIERIRIDRPVESVPPMREEGDVLVVPVIEEVPVVRRQLVLREELHIRRRRTVSAMAVPVERRVMHAAVKRIGPAGAAEIDQPPAKEDFMTDRTITALFDSRDDADTASRRLSQLGVPSQHVRITDRTTSGSTEGGQERGFWASLKHFFVADEDRDLYEHGVSRGGYLLTAAVPETQADSAMQALEDSNAVDLDQRQAQWRQEGWTGRSASARASTGLGGVAAASTAAGGAREDVAAEPETAPRRGADDREALIPVVKEQLRVGKREVARGGVRVRSYVVAEPVHESVRLHEEHVDVERRPVNREISATDGEGLLRERTVEMEETAEEAVVEKRARVTEEVVVRKRADERVEDVEDTIRHTEIDVEGAGRDSRPRRTPNRPGDAPR